MVVIVVAEVSVWGSLVLEECGDGGVEGLVVIGRECGQKDCSNFLWDLNWTASKKRV